MQFRNNNWSHKTDFSASNASSPEVLEGRCFQTPALEFEMQFSHCKSSRGAQSFADRGSLCSSLFPFWTNVETWWRNVLEPKSKWNSSFVVFKVVTCLKKSFLLTLFFIFLSCLKWKTSDWMENDGFLEKLLAWLDFCSRCVSQWRVIHLFSSFSGPAEVSKDV